MTYGEFNPYFGPSDSYWEPPDPPEYDEDEDYDATEDDRDDYSLDWYADWDGDTADVEGHYV